jgi:hypothetical protein
MILGAGTYLALKENNPKLTTIEACYKGMNELFSNNTDKKLHHKNLIADVKGKSFNVEHIMLVKMLDSTHCDVVVRDPKGFRSYLVTLEKNSKFTYFYRLFDVKGQKIISGYQHKGSL